jgi:hypothetical protein
MADAERWKQQQQLEQCQGHPGLGTPGWEHGVQQTLAGQVGGTYSQAALVFSALLAWPRLARTRAAAAATPTRCVAALPAEALLGVRRSRSSGHAGRHCDCAAGPAQQLRPHAQQR